MLLSQKCFGNCIMYITYLIIPLIKAGSCHGVVVSCWLTRLANLVRILGGPLVFTWHHPVLGITVETDPARLMVTSCFQPNKTVLIEAWFSYVAQIWRAK